MDGPTPGPTHAAPRNRLIRTVPAYRPAVLLEGYFIMQAIARLSRFVGNTFAYRCTDQERLTEVTDPVGPENDAALLTMAQQAGVVIAAYGTPRIKSLHARGPQVVSMLQQHGIVVHAMKIGANGRPCHPLYLPAALKPVVLPSV